MTAYVIRFDFPDTNLALWAAQFGLTANTDGMRLFESREAAEKHLASYVDIGGFGRVVELAGEATPMTNLSTVSKLYRRARHIAPLEAEKVWRTYLDGDIGPNKASAKLRSLIFVGSPT